MNTMIPGTNSTVNPHTVKHRKRTHTATHDGRKFNPTLAPPLPPLNGDLVLQVYTHKSLRPRNVSPDKFDDNERLAELGKAAFDLSLTRYLFDRRPMLKGQDLAVRWI
jgi:dsRNA-specific ribonuclease